MCVCLCVFICTRYWVSVFVDKWVLKLVDCFEFVKRACVSIGCLDWFCLILFINVPFGW
jgi:hypothetical protein